MTTPTMARRPRRRTTGDLLTRGLLYGSLVVMSIFMVLPFLWMVLTSIKPVSEIYLNPFFPQHPTLDAYVRLFKDWGALRSLWNSLYMAAASTALSVFLCALGGYAFAKLQFPGRKRLFSLMLASMALPFVVILVPLFVMMRNVFDWVDTPWPMIIPGAASAFGIFFMRQYMLSLPDEMLDAARCDGCSEFGTFWKVILPTSMPALLVYGIISFIGQWNGFLWASAILRSPEMQTMPVLLTRIEYANNLKNGQLPFDTLMAGSVLSFIPMFIVFMVFQRRLMDGLTTGAVKG